MDNDVQANARQKTDRVFNLVTLSEGLVFLSVQPYGSLKLALSDLGIESDADYQRIAKSVRETGFYDGGCNRIYKNDVIRNTWSREKVA